MRPDSLIDEMQAALLDTCLDPDRVHSERFGPVPFGPRSQKPRLATDTPHAVATIVVADGVSTAVSMEAGKTVLDAALRAGLDLPYSCGGGMCSTCRARVAKGRVRMDVNYGLEPWGETAVGYVLTCQARPETDRLIVGYDHL